MTSTKLLASLLLSMGLLAVACGSTANTVEQASAVSDAPAATGETPDTEAPETTETPETTATAAPTTTEATTTTALETTTTTAAPTTTTTPLYFVGSYDPSRDPFTDIDDAVSRAATEDKSVIAIVGGDWCPDCINIDAFITGRPELEASLTSDFIFVKVNLSEENENTEWLSQHPGFEWVPHFYIFDGAGELTDSYDTRGLMTSGLFDEAKFATFIADQASA